MVDQQKHPHRKRNIAAGIAGGSVLGGGGLLLSRKWKGLRDPGLIGPATLEHSSATEFPKVSPDVVEKIQGHLPYATLNINDFSQESAQGILDALTQTQAHPNIYNRLQERITHVGPLTRKGFDDNQMFGAALFHGQGMDWREIQALSTNTGQLLFGERYHTPQNEWFTAAMEHTGMYRPGFVAGRPVALHEMMHQIGYDIHGDLAGNIEKATLNNRASLRMQGVQFPANDLNVESLAAHVSRAGIPAEAGTFTRHLNPTVGRYDQVLPHHMTFGGPDVEIYGAAHDVSPYASTNIGEFFAETLATAIEGHHADPEALSFSNKVLSATEKTLFSEPKGAFLAPKVLHSTGVKKEGREAVMHAAPKFKSMARRMFKEGAVGELAAAVARGTRLKLRL